MAASDRKLGLELEEISQEKLTPPLAARKYRQPLLNIVATIDAQLYGTEGTDQGLFHIFLSALGEGYLNASKINPKDDLKKQEEAIINQLKASIPKTENPSTTPQNFFSPGSISNFLSTEFISTTRVSNYLWPKTAIQPLCIAFITLWSQLQTKFNEINIQYRDINYLQRFFDLLAEDEHVSTIIKGAEQSSTADISAEISDAKKALFKYLIQFFKELAIKRFYITQLMYLDLNPSELVKKIEESNAVTLEPEKKAETYEDELSKIIAKFNLETIERKKTVRNVLESKTKIEALITQIVKEKENESEKWKEELKTLGVTKRELDERYIKLQTEYSQFQATLKAANNHRKLFQADALKQDYEKLDGDIATFKMDHERFILSTKLFNEKIDIYTRKSLQTIDNLSTQITEFKTISQHVRNENITYYQEKTKLLSSSIDSILIALQKLEQWVTEKLSELDHILKNTPTKENITACFNIINKFIKANFPQLGEKTDAVYKLQYNSATAVLSLFTHNGAQRWINFADDIKKILINLENAINVYTSQGTIPSNLPTVNWEILKNQIDKNDFDIGTQLSVYIHLETEKTKLEKIKLAAETLHQSITSQRPSIDIELKSLFLPKNVEKELDGHIAKAKEEISNVTTYFAPKKLDLSKIDVTKFKSEYRKAYQNSEQNTQRNSVQLGSLRRNRRPANSSGPIIIESTDAGGIKGFFKRHWKKMLFTGVFISLLAVGIVTGLGWIPVIAGGISTLVVGASATSGTIAAFGVVAAGGFVAGTIGGTLGGVDEDLKRGVQYFPNASSSKENSSKNNSSDSLSTTKLNRSMKKLNLPTAIKIVEVQEFASGIDGSKDNYHEKGYLPFVRLANHARGLNQNVDYDPAEDLRVYNHYLNLMQEQSKLASNVVPISSDVKSNSKVSVTQVGSFKPLPLMIESVKPLSSEQQSWYRKMFSCG